MFVFPRSVTAVAAGLAVALLVVWFDRACNSLGQTATEVRVNANNSDLTAAARQDVQGGPP